MQNQDNPKSTEITPIRLFKFVFNTGGLRNAAQTMSGYIENIIKDLPCCYSYVDSHIASTDEESHKSSASSCESYHFRCLDNACISRGSYCDNKRDCLDNSDETYC
ncbi:hypothetical protein NPIL_371331, partial [Nephila pilipes]